MFYWLLYEVLFPLFSPFRVFGYVTVRVALAGFSALVLSVLFGPWLIDRLRQFQIRQYIREDGPKSHQAKAGTPTMGGVLILASIIVPTLLWADLRNWFVWLALFSLVAFGAIGFWDDYVKVINKRNLGLTSRQKLILQILAAALVAAALLTLRQYGMYATDMNVPFFKQFRPELLIPGLITNPWTYVLGVLPFVAFSSFVVVGASNAVNLTDGLDGLAAGLMVITAGAMTALAYVAGNRVLADYLDVARQPGGQELAVFCGAMTGACLGFLWHNAHPAQVFMGDVGALSLGGAVGTVAVLIKQELLLPFLCGVYIIEALSVMLQVASYKLRNGKRIFKMAPIHHHFEHSGWHETQVVTRFWIAGLIMALMALTTLKLR